jgi:arylsulfatase A-like enzyme
MGNPETTHSPARARKFPKAAVAVLILLALALAGGWYLYPRESFPARHVIVISLDTTRPDHFGCYGNTWIRTPRMDALAKESILFTKCISVVPTTLASHTSLFTGKYPHTHGVPRNGFTVNDENVMLPEVLKASGFHTAGFPAALPLFSRFDFPQGFDHYSDRFRKPGSRPAKVVTDRVLQYLDRTEVPSRLFLFAHYFDPHLPYAPPAKYVRMYDPEDARVMPHPQTQLAYRRETPGLQTPISRRMGYRYAGEITYMDEHLGRLIDGLRDRGILDEAILVIVSDHGENHWEHPSYFDHGFTLYDTTTRLVCMVRLPNGLHGGTRVDDLVSNIDIMPTILSFLGLKAPQEVEGQIIDLVQGAGRSSRRACFSEATKPWETVEKGVPWHNIRKSRSIREGDLKYIRTPYQNTEELYNLADDPGERHNLLIGAAPELRVKADELRSRLDQWADSARPLPTRFATEKREETVEGLKALGYLAGGSEDEDDEDEDKDEERPE